MQIEMSGGWVIVHSLNQPLELEQETLLYLEHLVLLLGAESIFTVGPLPQVMVVRRQLFRVVL